MVAVFQLSRWRSDDGLSDGQEADTDAGRGMGGRVTRVVVEDRHAVISDGGSSELERIGIRAAGEE